MMPVVTCDQLSVAVTSLCMTVCRPSRPPGVDPHRAGGQGKGSSPDSPRDRAMPGRLRGDRSAADKGGQ